MKIGMNVLSAILLILGGTWFLEGIGVLAGSNHWRPGDRCRSRFTDRCQTKAIGPKPLDL